MTILKQISVDMEGTLNFNAILKKNIKNPIFGTVTIYSIYPREMEQSDVASPIGTLTITLVANPSSGIASIASGNNGNRSNSNFAYNNILSTFEIDFMDFEKNDNYYFHGEFSHTTLDILDKDNSLLSLPLNIISTNVDSTALLWNLNIPYSGFASNLNKIPFLLGYQG